MGVGKFGEKSRFAITVGETLSGRGAVRAVDVWAADQWLTCEDDAVYAPQFAWAVKADLGALLRDPQLRRGRPHPELSIEENFRRLRTDAEADNAEYYRFMDWGPTADNVNMLLFQEGSIAYLAFAFRDLRRDDPLQLEKVFVAELPEWELAKVLLDAAWAIIEDWHDSPGQTASDVFW